MMIKFFAFAVLLTGCFILTECRWFDPASELEDRLSGITGCDVEITILLALKQLRPATNLSSGAKKLLELILSIPEEGQEDFCGGPSMKNLNDISEFVFVRSREYPANPRIRLLVRSLIERAYETCVKLFEEQLSDTAGHLLEEHYYLEQLRDLYKPDCNYERQHLFPNDPLNKLHGAVNFAARSEPRLDRFTLRSMLDKMYCIAERTFVDPRPCGLKINEKTGDQDDLTSNEAQRHFGKLLLEPCRSIFGNKKVQNVLEKVVDLKGAIMKYDHTFALGKKHKLLEWAAMGVTCNWIGQNKDMLVDKLAESLKGDPVFLLHSYLTDMTSQITITANIQAMRRLQMAELGESSPLKSSKKLIDLVSQLKLSGDADTCGGENLKNLRTTIETVRGYDDKSFLFPSTSGRLHVFLARYTKDALSKCLEHQLETDFEGNEYRLGDVNGLQFTLKPFFRINDEEQTPKYSRNSLDNLIDAETLPKGSYESWDDTIKTKLKSRLQAVGYSLEPEFDSLEKKIFGPCKSLTNNDEVKKILERVVDLGVAIRYAELGRESKIETLSVIEWAPIFVVCKWFHDSGVLEGIKLQ